MPADERLQGADRAGPQMHDRLIRKREAILLDGRPEVVFGLEHADDRCVHLFVEDPVATSTCLLGLVHGGVGRPEDVLGVLEGRVPDDHAYAAGGRHLLLLEGNGSPQLFLDAVDDRQYVAGAGDRVEQDHELVASHAGDGVNLADATRQLDRHAPEEHIPGQVADAVVDELEPVQIEHQDGEDRVFPTPGQADGLFEPGHEQRPVW